MMQSLRVVGRLFPDILSGKKRSTIRWREQRITPGYMRYIHHDDPSRTVVIWVTRCTDMPLSQAASYLGRETEWPKEVMLEGMREHYPAIAWDDEVQIVEHLTPRETACRPDFPT
jgi:hypothetical protein